MLFLYMKQMILKDIRRVLCAGMNDPPLWKFKHEQNYYQKEDRIMQNDMM